MDNQKVLVANGTLPDLAEVSRFLTVLREGDLRQHRAQNATIHEKGDGFHVTLYIKAEAQPLLEGSFETGALQQWKKDFKIGVFA